MKFGILSASICLLIPVLFYGQDIGADNESLKNLSICTTYGKEGTISRVVVRPNQDETQPIRIDFIERPSVEQVLQKFVPESDRGPRTGEQRSNFGRATGETIFYSRWVLTITTACNEEACGVSYAELKKRKSQE